MDRSVYSCGATFRQATCTVIYLAHPYAPWERSHNQNTKGFIRRYFPKRRGLTTDPKHQIKHAMDKLNIGLKNPWTARRL
jgi:IS30 family transposase